MALDERGVALPPSDAAAEEALLGSVFMDQEVVGRCARLVSQSDFYNLRSGVLWGVMVAIYERGEPVDPVTIMDEYARQKVEPDTSWVFGLLGSVPTPINAESYARLIAEKATKRRLISAASKIVSLGYRDDVTAESALSQSDALLSSVSEGRSSSGFRPIDTVLEEYQDEEKFIAAAGGDQTAFRVPTGFVALDRILNGGLGRSDLTLLAARPAMGKSSLGLAFALNAAIRYRSGVGIFSLEMTARQLVGRMVAIESTVPTRMIRESTATSSQMRMYSNAVGRIADAPIWIDETPGLSIGSIRMRARQLQRTALIDLLIVDHMQLIQGTNPKETMIQRMTEVSLALKTLARELNIPVVALAQLSRVVDGRKPPIPILSDLRESGTLEQDADNVLFIYRADYYDKNTERPGTADVIVGKQRNGETGSVPLLWNAQTTRFFGVEEYVRERT